MEFKMKSRAITLGASVIALSLAGATQAQADVLGNDGPLVPDTGIAPKVEATVKLNVKTGVDAAPIASLQGALKTGARRSDHPRITVEAKHRTGGQQSAVVLESNGDSLSADAARGRKGKFELEARGHAGPRHAGSTVAGSARRGGKASVGSSARIPTEKRIRAHSDRVAQTASVDFPRGHKKLLTPLQGIGRAVGNATQLIHAGWLFVLTAAGCLGLPGLMRRLNRAS
jgi:hypothetical protein